MFGPDAVAELNAVLVARAAAIAVILALRKEGTEHAVLHMEHRHVLVEGDLKPRRRGGLQQRRQLGGIEVI